MKGVLLTSFVFILLIVLNGIEILSLPILWASPRLLIVLNGIEIRIHALVNELLVAFNRTKWN